MSLLGAPLRRGFRVALAAYFRRIDADGAQAIPPTGPVLLVPNHVNALVDPLVIQSVVRRPLTLTAKSTLAKNPLVRVLMRALDVVALHRAQDRAEGADPARNVAALGELERRLAAGAAVCIFPEGVSHSDPQVRPFKTGPARIALEHLAAGEPGGGGLTLVPVGLHYDAKDTWRSNVWVRFGAPFRVADWAREHPGGDARELTGEIERRVRALTLNFERRRESVLLSWAAEVLLTDAAPPAMLGREETDAPRLRDRVELVERLQAGYERIATDPAVEQLATRVREYRARLIRLGISPAEVFLPMHAGRAAFFVLREVELLLVGLPLALWGTLNHLLPYLCLRGIARALSTDRDHWASNTVLPGIVVVPFFYAVQLALAWWRLPVAWAALYTIALPYGGWYAVLYRDRAGGIVRRVRTFFRFLLDRALQRRLVEEGAALVREIQALAPRVESAPVLAGTERA